MSVNRVIRERYNNEMYFMFLLVQTLKVFRHVAISIASVILFINCLITGVITSIENVILTIEFDYKVPSYDSLIKSTIHFYKQDYISEYQKDNESDSESMIYSDSDTDSLGYDGDINSVNTLNCVNNDSNENITLNTHEISGEKNVIEDNSIESVDNDNSTYESEISEPPDELCSLNSETSAFVPIK